MTETNELLRKIVLELKKINGHLSIIVGNVAPVDVERVDATTGSSSLSRPKKKKRKNSIFRI